MGSEILRSRPGRPRWQLTTRPSTAALLGVVSLVAVGAQLALLSSPTPWYQWAVAGFWTVVGLAFLASAAGTRARDRRAAQARSRVPVDSVPFVPVPIRPARPRRRDQAGRDGAGRDRAGRDRAGRDRAGRDEAGKDDGRTSEVHTGAPTDDLADAVQTAVTPVVSAAPAVALPSGTTPARRRDPEPAEPTTGTRGRHAVRAVLSVETVSREIPIPAAADVPAARDVHRPAARGRTTPAAHGPTAPSGTVPSPRRTPEGAGPERDVPRPGTSRATESHSAPSTGASTRHVSRMTFGSSPGRESHGSVSEGHRPALGPAPVDTGRHALVERRDVPAPRDSTSSPRRARHAAPTPGAEIR